jgi:hypothetical protein
MTLPREMIDATVKRSLADGIMPMTATPPRPCALPPIFLAVPSMAWSWTVCTRAIMMLQPQLPAGSKCAIGFGQVTDVASARNHLVDDFLKTSLKYVLFLDSDMLPPPDTGLRMLCAAEQRNLDVLAAPYCKRGPPYEVTAVLKTDGKADALVETPVSGVHEILSTGFGCVLVHRRVIEKMTGPHFEYPEGRPHEKEDTYFCQKAIAAGFRLWADFSLEVGHVTPAAVTIRAGVTNVDVIL